MLLSRAGMLPTSVLIKARKCILPMLMALLASGASKAAWLEAASANFVVYADGNETNLRRLSEQLELYHQAMERLVGMDLPEPSPSNRVVVYVLRNEQQVLQLFGKGAQNITGFYIARAGGSVAIVPRIRAQTDETHDSMITLLHEYAHHFILSNSRAWIPQWLSEGSAEFFASARFPSNGGIVLGAPAEHRI